MSKILITGNGFDLFHHLPTKYHHFISIMLTIEGNQYNNDVSFVELFGDIFKTKHEFEYNAINENYNTDNINFSHEKLNRIKQLLEVNLWYKHFKNVTEIDTWIDFEIEVENVLNQLKLFNKYLDNRAIRKNNFIDPLIEFSNFEIFNILKIQGANGYFILDLKYINKRKSLIDLKKIVEDLLISFEDFIKIFNRYLVDVISVFYKEVKKKSVIPFHLMDEIYSFNYTPTFENIYNIDKSKIVYLHGKIHEDCQSQNLVLGISEINEEVKKSKIYGFAKYYQKVNKSSNNKFIEVPKQVVSNLNETIFYIIGHSLDSSDKEYIVDLFKFLKLDYNKYSKICIFYFSKKDKENKWNNLFSIIEKDVVLEMNKFGRLYFVELSVDNVLYEFTKNLKSGNTWSM